MVRYGVEYWSRMMKPPRLRLSLAETLVGNNDDSDM
jgi:hypothetical protein